MLTLTASSKNTNQQIADLQASLNEARNKVGIDTGGMDNQLILGLQQIDRFVAANIQVRTGRTKNSIFQHVSRDGNRVQAGLHSNVKYSPYVGYQPKRSSTQFFKYAAQVEGPRVANSVAVNIVTDIEGSF